MAKNKQAFSIIEVIVAIALFALAGFAISQACYNMTAPMMMKDKDSESDANLELALAEILKVSDYDALDDGIDVDGIDGETYRVYGEFEQTEILDLFKLKVNITSPRKNYERTLLVIRPKWYENISDRDDLKEDRVDLLDQKRRNEYFNRK